jgi:hypothetical protein
MLAHATTASRVETDTDFVTRDRLAIEECGFQIFDIDLEDLAPETCQDELKTYDIIYVLGGRGGVRPCVFILALLRIQKLFACSIFTSLLGAMTRGGATLTAPIYFAGKAIVPGTPQWRV